MIINLTNLLTMIDFNNDALARVVKLAVKEAIYEYDQEKRREVIPPGARWLTRQQTADYLGISVKTVDLWARIGKLKRIYIKGSPRFDREFIDQSFDELKKYKRA
jgi:DNA-directed RNA polymerase specialized sigma24 family protein